MTFIQMLKFEFLALRRRLFGYPVDGDTLLKEARHARVGDQDVLVFERTLTTEQQVALKLAWERLNQNADPQQITQEK
jgi:hypothetical protein